MDSTESIILRALNQAHHGDVRGPLPEQFEMNESVATSGNISVS